MGVGKGCRMSSRASPAKMAVPNHPLPLNGQAQGGAKLAAPLERPMGAAAIVGRQKRSRTASSTRRRPRIAMVSTHGYVSATPPLGAMDTGGQVVYVIELSKKLAQLGYDVDIWTRRFEDLPETDVVDAHVRVVRVPSGGRAFIRKEILHREAPEWTAHALRRIAEEGLRYEFVNSHYWDGGVAGEGLASALAIPHVHTPHSLGIWKRREMEGESAQSDSTPDYNFDERIGREAALYRSCDMLIATTPQQVEMIVADYGIDAEKVTMIPPGYDDLRFYPVSSSSRELLRHQFGFEVPTVLAMGRLAKNKGYDLLIDGFARLVERLPSAVLQLSIGGTGSDESSPMLDELRSQAQELGLSRSVRFGGYVPDQQLPDLYRAADLFVLSSRYEPFGMTAIEAMACGTPTVVTIHGGLQKAITYGRHALYADPLDADDLGITMLKPLQFARVWSRLSRMGAHRARSLFSWSAVAQQLIAAVDGHAVPSEFVDREWDEPWNDGD